MKKQILEYNLYVAKLMEQADETFDYQQLAAEYLVKIQFYQHERLIHLIVTVLFALMEAIVVVTATMAEGIGLPILAFVIMILLVPYIGHYYFLENTVQKMYLTYDDILEKAKKGK